MEDNVARRVIIPRMLWERIAAVAAGMKNTRGIEVSTDEVLRTVLEYGLQPATTPTAPVQSDGPNSDELIEQLRQERDSYQQQYDEFYEKWNEAAAALEDAKNDIKTLESDLSVEKVKTEEQGYEIKDLKEQLEEQGNLKDASDNMNEAIRRLVAWGIAAGGNPDDIWLSLGDLATLDGNGSLADVARHYANLEMQSVLAAGGKWPSPPIKKSRTSGGYRDMPLEKTATGRKEHRSKAVEKPAEKRTVIRPPAPKTPPPTTPPRSSSGCSGFKTGRGKPPADPGARKCAVCGRAFRDH